MLARLSTSFVGLMIGVLLLQFGFWEALFLVLCASIGWWIGGHLIVVQTVQRLFDEGLTGWRKWRG